jgi:hypothetical protein
MNQQIFLGQTPLQNNQSDIQGGFVTLENEKFYKISNYQQMPDFFMTIVSVADHWMFISSNGSLTAGRKNRNNALFPYYCVDKIHDYYDISGNKTLVLVTRNGKKQLWEPFSKKLEHVYHIERNLYKSIYGNKIIFEEVNHDLGLSFQYGWYFSDSYGFIKKSKLSNTTKDKVSIEILDGLKNLLPNGFDYHFQLEYSNLLDAYKKNERVADTNLGLFTLSSVPVDRAEPSESLNATTVWTVGLEKPVILLSDNQTENFKKGMPLSVETEIRATRGAYFVNQLINLKANESKNWLMVAEINQDSTKVANLNQWLSQKQNFEKIIDESIAADTIKLRNIIAQADGLQMTNEELSYARHYANTIFNVMRGGIFIDNYWVTKTDFSDFVSKTNKMVFASEQNWIAQLPDKIEITNLLKCASETKNYDLVRICHEYLPLTFSRRHGDPSRPWNQFSIDIQNPDGSVKSDYQGNWRDIFQNWETLALSYPGFVEQMISKFVNASTADGYNPYRVSRNGIDWERPDPDDAWAFIGYWGDHQVIYLQKLVELSHRYHPGELNALMASPVFAYANVPYRIKKYKDILKNPQDTIVFDYDLDKQIGVIAEKMGADGKLILDKNEQVYKVNLTEKILVSLLTKLSNFVPEAGIWLNTQRPEWNDANNALVGNGVSMVTLYYMRRSLNFWVQLFSENPLAVYECSVEVKTFFDKIYAGLADTTEWLDSKISDANRKLLTDVLGKAGSEYRELIYSSSFSGAKKELRAETLINFAKVCLKHIDHSIEANKRADGLYHAYNLISIKESGISIRYLYEMLEGQVAVLTSGYLSAKASLAVLDALKVSQMFRPDQYSYMLYPDRALPLFMQKNNVPAEAVHQSKLLSSLLKQGQTTIIAKDANGNYHFNGAFRNAFMLKDALSKLPKQTYGKLLESELELIVGIYEQMFDHQSFTGRSGTFFGFEGLGSIYWHMVSKLWVVAQEAFYKGIDEQVDAATQERLKVHYYEIKAGIGLYKSPKLYGAFPTDAYSHTPKHAGAQQPGMTGQVKEDIIARFGELGLVVKDGQIHFQNSLLNTNELLAGKSAFEYLSLKGDVKQIKLDKSELAYTFCGVPIVYKKANKSGIRIELTNKQSVLIGGLSVDKEHSSQIFNRTGHVEIIEVSFPG